MTREEVIAFFKDNECTYGKLEAVEMPIKALEQQPCEDAISRQAVIEIAKSSKSNWIDNSVLYKRVNELSPVNPQPKTGHWIHLKHNKGKCSECHDVVLIAQMYGNANYCPNCGARMIESQTESVDK